MEIQKMAGAQIAKISKKQKAKNLSSNTPDEQHTTTTSEAKVDKPMIW